MRTYTTHEPVCSSTFVRGHTRNDRRQFEGALELNRARRHAFALCLHTRGGAESPARVLASQDLVLVLLRLALPPPTPPSGPLLFSCRCDGFLPSHAPSARARASRRLQVELPAAARAS